jgi:DNA-directed RNA polymerase subunit M/transcription elongation factor TFIIS
MATQSYLASLQQSLRQFQQDPSKFEAPSTPLLAPSSATAAAAAGCKRKKAPVAAAPAAAEGTEGTEPVAKKVKKPLTEEQKAQRKATRESNKRKREQEESENGGVPAKKAKKVRVKKADLEQQAHEEETAKKKTSIDAFRRQQTLRQLIRMSQESRPVVGPDILNHVTFSPELVRQCAEYQKRCPFAETFRDLLDDDTDEAAAKAMHHAHLVEYQLYVASGSDRSSSAYQTKLQQVLFNFGKNGAHVIKTLGADITTLVLLDDSQWAMQTDVERRRTIQDKRLQQYQQLVQDDEKRDKEFLDKLMPEGSDTEWLVCKTCKSRDKKDPSIRYEVDWFQTQTRSADEPMRTTVLCRNPNCGARSTYK